MVMARAASHINALDCLRQADTCEQMDSFHPFTQSGLHRLRALLTFPPAGHTILSWMQSIAV
jgi:hypothetical protein